jgi:hypothetical protein
MKRIEVWLPEKIERKLKELADQKGLKISEAARLLLVENLAGEKNER